MGSPVAVGTIHTSGQIFVFGAMCYVADSTSHLSQVETYAPGRIIHFGNLEYVADSRSELVLQGLAPCQAQEQQAHHPLHC